MGAIAGTVVRGGTSPIVIEGQPPETVPVAGAKVIVSVAGHGTVKTVSTDAAGRYQGFVAPGTYVVTLGSGTDGMFTKSVPATLSVGNGEVVMLDILLDNGIR